MQRADRIIIKKVYYKFCWYKYSTKNSSLNISKTAANFHQLLRRKLVYMFRLYLIFSFTSVRRVVQQVHFNN